MEPILHIVIGLLSAAFWAVFVSYVPITLYLLFVNPWIFRAQRTQDNGVFFIHAESDLNRRRRERNRVVLGIYLGCVTLLLAGYLLKGDAGGQFFVSPFNILSSLSVILFWASAATYIPIACYLVINKPWQFRDDQVCLSRMYIIFGLVLLVFAVMFALDWCKKSSVPIGVSQIAGTLFIIVFASAMISYIPILCYVLTRLTRRFKRDGVHLNTIFVIYCLCFLLFSGVYVINWVSDRQTGIPMENTPKLHF